MSDKPRSRDEARRAKNARRAVCCLFDDSEIAYMKNDTDPSLKNATAVQTFVRKRIRAERAGGAR